MTPVELRCALEKQFELVVFQDLAWAWRRHGAIFDIFRDAYRPSFLTNQRLILYSEHDLEQDFLDHVQRAAARIDISNHFIMIVSAFDVAKKLRMAVSKFGHGDAPMDTRMVDLEGTMPLEDRGFRSIQNICPLPFGHAAINQTGDVYPCCKHKVSVGSTQTHDINHIFHGPTMQELRTQMLQGRRSENCSVCWHNEDAGTTSYRQLAMTEHGDKLDQEWLDNPELRHIGWAPMTLCNFACRICGPHASTSWAKEEILFSSDSQSKNQLKSLIRRGTDIDHSDRMIHAVSNLPHLEHLHILGGEPLLWPGMSDMIDLMIELARSKKISLQFNTNGSVFPDTQLASMIDQFRSLAISISIDNVGRRFEIERGGSWASIFHNLKKFAALRSETVQIKIIATINLQNVLYLDDLVALSHDLDLDIVWWYLESPKALCIDHATEAVKNRIQELYEHHAEPELRRISQRAQQSSGSDGRLFLQHCAKLDQRRHQDFSSTHQEIFWLMGGRFQSEHVLA